MKLLVVCVLGCAMMVLAGAAAEGAADENNQPAISEVSKRTYHCYYGWSRINRRLFRYISHPMTWAAAERYCQAIGGNLASVHNCREYRGIQRLIISHTHCYTSAWLGGSDAQQEGVWLWSDGTRFRYTNWSCGEPNNAGGRQHCLQMNYGGQRRWDDLSCNSRRPFVCAKK